MIEVAPCRDFSFWLIVLATLGVGTPIVAMLLDRAMGPWTATAIEHDGSTTTIAFDRNQQRPDWVAHPRGRKHRAGQPRCECQATPRRLPHVALHIGAHAGHPRFLSHPAFACGICRHRSRHRSNECANRGVPWRGGYAVCGAFCGRRTDRRYNPHAGRPFQFDPCRTQMGTVRFSAREERARLICVTGNVANWCGRPDLNRHRPYGPTDFKSGASTIPPRPLASLLPL